MLPDEKAFQSLIDTVQGALLLLSPEDGRVFAANQLAAILLGVPHAELLGESFFQHLVNRADERSLLDKLGTQGIVYNEAVTVQSRAGRKFEVQLSLRHIDFQRRVLMVSFSDRTELALLGRLLESERGALEKMLKLVRELKPSAETGNPDDYLSGVLDMPALFAGLAQEVGRAGRYNQPLSAMLVSVEGVGGQELDAETAGYIRRMTGSLCLQSARDSDLVARRDDGCLLVVLPHTPLQGATRAARRLIAQFSRQRFSIGSEERNAAVCIGLTSLRRDETSLKPLIQRLDTALARSRAQGVNTLSRQP
ncbi:sensor domain-containing diguanylate cyclase [Crenobacter intestini]|uniref:Diguanylate cyclase n=1 Tax=Crenobacter intestini TaxID=2563443 RepID=A0A4V4N7W0_9NEIS|nr:PAS domain-containing protein [Crenobacter intestini]TIC82103.1 diguanylate cyclase [Crenobacter intestini]